MAPLVPLWPAPFDSVGSLFSTLHCLGDVHQLGQAGWTTVCSDAYAQQLGQHAVYALIVICLSLSTFFGSI